MSNPSTFNTKPSDASGKIEDTMRPKSAWYCLRNAAYPATSFICAIPSSFELFPDLWTAVRNPKFLFLSMFQT